MKKQTIIFLSLCLMLSASVSYGQKYCYINTEYILENIPEYKSAQQQLDQISVQWQKEIEGRYTVIDKLYKDYQAEQILLTEDMRKKREAEITAKEKEVKDLQKQRFGYEGDLFKKKQEIVKPIQDKIYNAVKKMATDQSYAVIFDKSGELTILYANPKYDKSDEILLQLGYKAGTKSSGSGDKGKTDESPSNKNDQENPSNKMDQQAPKNERNQLMQSPK
ncbi:MAG TPA: OmpH family outer membrane protein [Bacteroidia bacterium]|nr:OmpH family outer membrane protein [Bacteroidia bacterium]